MAYKSKEDRKAYNEMYYNKRKKDKDWMKKRSNKSLLYYYKRKELDTKK